MADDEDDLILSDLDDEELVQQMHDAVRVDGQTAVMACSKNGRGVVCRDPELRSPEHAGRQL